MKMEFVTPEEWVDRFSYLYTARHVFFVYVYARTHRRNCLRGTINNHLLYLRCGNISQTTLFYH